MLELSFFLHEILSGTKKICVYRIYNRQSVDNIDKTLLPLKDLFVTMYFFKFKLTESWRCWSYPSSYMRYTFWFIGYMKSVFHGSSWLLLLLRNSEVCKLTPFPLLTPLICYLLFICESYKRIKDGKKKTRIPLDSNYILGFMTILWCRMFSWAGRNSHVSLRQGLEVYHRIIFSNYKFEGQSCVQWVCLAEAATCRKDTSC